MGIRAEKTKSFLVATHEPIRIVLLLMLLVFGFLVLRSWKNANDMTGATQAKLNGILDKLGNKIDSVQIESLNELLASGKGRIDDLAPLERELTGFIADNRRNANMLTESAVARINQLGENLTSVKNATDEARAQIKQNGDEVIRTVASLNRTITDIDTHVTKILANGSLMLETSNPKIQELLDHANAVIIDTDGRIKAFEPIQTNMAGITGDLNAMTTDSKNKLHSIFWPEPKHGWARVGQLATYLLQPIWEGTRVYFSIKSLPVRITQPIPLR